jgi:hypothetical protein
MKKFALLAASSFFTPLLAAAQTRITNVTQLGNSIIGIINNVLVPLVFAIAFIVFIWGVFMYFIQGGSDEEKRTKGQQLMLYGIIGFFVMVSVWGLVNILIGTFAFNSSV